MGTPNTLLAKRFAELAHANKLYGEDTPYTVHLENVVNVLRRFGYTDAVIECGAWLHDTIEDCGISYNDIKSRFGFDVAELVYYVTDEKGRNRAERSEKTYPLIKDKLEPKKLKLADRISNVEWSAANKGKYDMYKKEYSKFKEYLYIEGELEDMWSYLDILLGE